MTSGRQDAQRDVHRIQRHRAHRRGAGRDEPDARGVDNNIAGIDADCGGECACATCHVYVDAAWLERTGLPEPGSQEETMLSFAAAAQPNSRLTCQIRMREELAGIVLRMPEGQH